MRCRRLMDTVTGAALVAWGVAVALLITTQRADAAATSSAIRGCPDRPAPPGDAVRPALRWARSAERAALTLTSKVAPARLRCAATPLLAAATTTCALERFDAGSSRPHPALRGHPRSSSDGRGYVKELRRHYGIEGRVRGPCAVRQDYDIAEVTP